MTAVCNFVVAVTFGVAAVIILAAWCWTAVRALDWAAQRCGTAASRCRDRWLAWRHNPAKCRWCQEGR